MHKGRRALSKNSGSWVIGGNEHGALVCSASDDHPKAELGRPPASYKWDDAERWISAVGPAPPPDTLYRATSANVNMYGRLPKFAPPVGIRPMQVQPYQPSTEPMIFTQDKHIPACVGRAIARNDQWKRDVGTQSTPAGLSQCDSPEVCTATSSADEKSNSKDAATTATATVPHTGSPPRHNTPERTSASYAKEPGNVHPCDDGGGAGKLDLVALQSCHLEKLSLAQDLPLGTSSTWLLLADDDNEQAVDLIGRGCLPPRHHYQSHAIKVNMLEARVAAWEDVERAKYIAKFKKEEAKIEAWESLRRAEANAELQKLEVKLEKMRFESREKIMGRLEAAQRRAQEMKGIAEAHKKEQLTRLASRASLLRKSGNLPSAAFNVMCSLSAKIKPT